MKKDAVSQSILESTDFNVLRPMRWIAAARESARIRVFPHQQDIPRIFRPLTRRPLPGFSLARSRKSGFDGTHPQPCGTLPVCVHEIARRGKP